MILTDRVRRTFLFNAVFLCLFAPPAPATADSVPKPSLAGVPQEPAQMSEKEAIRRIRQLIERQVLAAYKNGQRPAQRDAHAKQHGCVRASFTVSASLPPALRQGIFASAHTFHAWIR